MIENPGLQGSSNQRFELIHERDLPVRRRARLGGAFFNGLAGTARAAIEHAYVTLAKGVMRQSEAIEDGLAERRYNNRVGRNRKRLPPPRPRAGP